MKKLALTALAGLMFAAALPSIAATATGNFSVNVSLTSACQLSTPPSDITISYTSFGAAESADTDFSVLCTDGLSYTLSLDAANADTMGLTIPLAIRDSGDTADVSGSQTQSGAAAQGYKVKATISAGQQGTCTSTPATPCTANVPRVLTVSY